MTKETQALEFEIEDLKSKLRIAAELNHHMWELLQEQIERTAQLERILEGKAKWQKQ